MKKPRMPQPPRPQIRPIVVGERDVAIPGVGVFVCFSIGLVSV